MTNKELLDIAEYAELSPTFTNWFEDKPHQVVRELYKFFKLKQDILDTLQREADYNEMECDDYYDKYNNSEIPTCEEMANKIKALELPKEGLFE